MLMPFNQLTTAPPSETRWFLYLPWQPTWILAPGMSLFFSLNLISCCCLVAKSCQTLCDPMGCSPPGSLSMVFPRQEYWSGLPYPSPLDLPDLGIEPASPALAGGFFLTAEPSGKPYLGQISGPSHISWASLHLALACFATSSSLSKWVSLLPWGRDLGSRLVDLEEILDCDLHYVILSMSLLKKHISSMCQAMSRSVLMRKPPGMDFVHWLLHL